MSLLLLRHRGGIRRRSGLPLGELGYLLLLLVVVVAGFTLLLSQVLGEHHLELLGREGYPFVVFVHQKTAFFIGLRRLGRGVVDWLLLVMCQAMKVAFLIDS